MLNILKHVGREFFLWYMGGCIYFLLEVLYRGYSHWTMFLLGGFCFSIIGIINEVFSWKMPLISQMFISMIVITSLEFITGCIVNLLLHYEVWDYSLMPYNVCGQICLLFTIFWFFLSIIGIIVDDYIRYFMLGEEKPRYKLFM